ncbi:MAG: DUF4375 domain-containing protein [Oscillospiraceae bacterium]|nr:DUF4375 domain-containing protein [Oscillospiraceae bacterium]
MKKSGLFCTQLFLNAIRYGLLFAVAVIVTVIGAVWIDICLYIGFGLLALYAIICLGSTISMNMITKQLSEENPEFNAIMEKLANDPDSFIAESMANYDEMKQLHGEALLALSDDDLFEAVYFQNLDIAESAEDEDKELEQFSGPRRTVYILSMFDMEIQNGGLCQFFVNSSSAVAPYVSESLRCVGANEHLNLFEEFITANNIDISNLESFKVSSIRGFKKQTKRFDFDAFDDAYYELPALQEKVVTYIKNNINEF